MKPSSSSPLGLCLALCLLFTGGFLSAADLPVTAGVTDKTSSDYTLDGAAVTLELRDPSHRWIWFTHFTRPGDYTVSAKVAVAQANAGAVLRVGHWQPQHGKASSAETALTATDPSADVNPQWQALGTIRIPTPGDHTLFARIVSQSGPGPGLLHAIRLTGPGVVTSATSWEARTSACDPGTTGAGTLRRARYSEVIPRPWPLPSIGGTFTTCQAPGGYLGCQEGFFWSSWESGGVFPDILVSFGGTRDFGHEGSGRTITSAGFSLPLERRRKSLVLHKPDGSGTNLATVLIGEAGQGWHLLGRMRRPAGGTSVSSTLGFLENPGTFNSNLHRRSSAWGNPWFFGEETGSGTSEWWQASQLKAHLRGPSPTGPPPLPRATYPWGETRLRQDLMEMSIGGQIPIAQNDTYFPTPAAPLPDLPTLNLAYDLVGEDHVHQAPDATLGAAYSATLATLIRDPFSTLDFTFAKDSGPAWLSVATDGTLSGTPSTPGQHLLTVTATDPDAGLSGTFTAGIYVKDSSNNPPAFLDHPAAVPVAAANDEGDVLPLRFHDPDAGDNHTLAITAGNTGNTFSIDPVRGVLVKNSAPAANSTWNLTLTVTDDGSPAASDTLVLEVTSGPADVTGGAFSELWSNMGGTTVTDLAGDPRYPDNPSRVSMTGPLEDSGPGKNTGTRVRGWIHPPASGDYTFWISGENAAEFHLSTDHSPANLAMTCESSSSTSFRNYDVSAEQESATIPLVSGQRYYFEVLQKNAGTTGGFDGSYSVAWNGPGLAREPIPAGALSAWRHIAPAFHAGTIALRPVLSGEPYLEFLQTKLRTLYLHPALTYTGSAGPAWLQVAADGTLTGTPGPTDAGTNTFTLRATAPGGLFTESTFTIEVSANQPPQFTSSPLVVPAIDESTPLNTSIADQATDPNVGAHFGTGDRLAFSLVTAPPWLHLDETGTLYGTPTADDLGLNHFTIAATDLGGLSTQVAGEITVNDVAIAPVFVSDPITLSAVPGLPFSSALSPLTFDPDSGDVLTFTKLAGPAWLTVGDEGQLTGTAGDGEFGLNSFSIKVTDELGQSDTATLAISVQDPDPAVYEGFEGAAATPLGGFGSGTGWAGEATWTRFGGTTGSTTLGTPNAFPGLPARGQSAALAGGEDLRRDLDHSFTLGNGPGEYSELWLSFLLDNPGPIAAGHECRLALQDNGSDLLAFGKEINARWRLRGGGSSLDFTGDITNSNLGNWLAVVRLAFDGTDTIATAWLARDDDPGLDLTDPATIPRTGSVTLPGSVSFDGIALRSHNTSSARLDEIALAGGYERVLAMAGDHDSDGDPNFSDPDDDNDGMSDSWEGLHGLDPLTNNANLDPDGDGFTNLEEFVADTAPFDGTDRPRLHLDTIQPGGILRISFLTSPARLYHLEATGDLSAAPWPVIAPNIVGTGAMIEINDHDAAPLPVRFYRLRIELP